MNISVKKNILVQVYLLRYPDPGKIVPVPAGSESCAGQFGKGKSGGIRVIYYWKTAMKMKSGC